MVDDNPFRRPQAPVTPPVATGDSNPFRRPQAPVAAQQAGPATVQNQDGFAVPIAPGTDPTEQRRQVLASEGLSIPGEHFDAVNTPAQPSSPQHPGALSEGLSGLNEGLVGDTLGAPVDLMTAIWNHTVVPGANAVSRNVFGAGDVMSPEVKPFLGSAYINGLQEQVGTVLPPSEDYQLLRRGARVAGGALGTAVPVGVAARLATPLRDAAGLATPAAQGAGFARKAVEPVLEFSRNSPLAAAGADVASAAGAGAGHAVGDVASGNDPLIAAITATAGGLLAPLAAASPAMMARQVFTSDPAAAEARLAAFERQGVRPTAATVGGGRLGTTLDNVGDQVPLPGNPVSRARSQQQEQMAARADELARSAGGTPASDIDEFGGIVRREATAGSQRLRDEIAKMETAFSGRFGADTPVSLANTRASIARMIDKADPESRAMLQSRLNLLDEATGTAKQRADIADTIGRLQQFGNDPAIAPTAQAEIARLQQQAADLDRVPFRVFDNLRKRIGVATDGQSIGAQFTGPVYGGLAEDMKAAARARGLGDDWTRMKSREEQLYNSDRSAAEGGDLDLLAPAGGNSGGGDIFRQFVGSEFQNGDRLGALMRNTTSQGRADIQASTIAHIGRATPGQQNAAGDLFSPSTFLTNWNKMSASAKQQIFGDDVQLMSDLDDLAKIAEGMRNVRSTSNPSGTGRVLVTGGAGAAAFSNPIAAAGGAAGGYAGLGLLASRRLAQWAASRGPGFSSRFANLVPGLAAATSQPVNDPQDPLAKLVQGRDPASRGTRADGIRTGDPLLDSVLR